MIRARLYGGPLDGTELLVPRVVNVIVFQDYTESQPYAYVHYGPPGELDQWLPEARIDLFFHRQPQWTVGDSDYCPEKL
jgi:hypothetical protein